MNFTYDILFTVNFKHTYFKTGNFSGLTVTPSGDTEQVMRNYGLVFKAFADRFTVMYDTAFAGANRSRESLLAEDLALDFRLALADNALYNYTAGLPVAINDALFYFSNVAADGSARSTLLHQDEFVSTKDLVNAADAKTQYFYQPFGHVEIRSIINMEKNMHIQFAAKEVYWQYILLTAHLKDLHAPAILNKDTGKIFSGPEEIELPESLTATAFTSSEPIVMTNKPNRFFQLVENYAAGSDRHKIVMDVLPNPDINNISQNFSKQKQVGENNVITIIL